MIVLIRTELKNGVLLGECGFLIIYGVILDGLQSIIRNEVMKCLNCVKEATGRSKYCSDKCKVSYNRNKKRNDVTETESVTDVYKSGADSLSTHHERFVAGGGKDNCLARLPANFGASDCMCKMCIGNRAKPTPLILNHGVWKRCDQLGRDEINRVPLPGDVDYVGVAV